MMTPAEPQSPNGTAATTPSEPWWKRAPTGPPPRWASPAAARRAQLQRSVLPSRMTARTDGATPAPSDPATPEPSEETAEARAGQP